MYSVLGLLLALGILVTVHEYGHFWVARRFGVKVLRFSVGFGRPLFKWTDKLGTEFAVAWIPLGGYVKMLDEREGEVAAAELPHAFTQKKPYQKILIALAGPVANFLFAIFAFALLYMIGVRDLTPVLAAAQPDTVAMQAGVERGDKVLSVDGKAIESFSQLNLALAARVGESGSIVLEVDRNGLRKTLTLPINNWLSDAQSPNPLADLGLYPMMPAQPAVIGDLQAGEAAEKAGLQRGDLILQANSETISDWLAWVEVIRANANQAINVDISREGQRLQIQITPGARTNDDGSVTGFIGAGTIAEPIPEEQFVTTRLWPGAAILKGITETNELVVLSYQSLGKMLTGDISLKQVGGPISMAQMAGRSVQYGFESFVGFLAFISISLAIVNLLPIPVLDGGHVVIHSLEWLKGGPLSDRAQFISMQIGLVFVLLLMSLSFINDIGRIM